MSELLTPEQVAQRAHLSKQAVYRAIRAGELRATRLRSRLRIEESDYQEWVEHGRVSEPATPPPVHPIRQHNPRGLRILLPSESSSTRGTR